MKNTTVGLLLALILATGFQQKARAQTIELLAGSTFNGAMNGTILGGAAMALGNTNDFAPLRVGLGLGILGGIGMGAYDVSYGMGNEILVSGMFNDGNNSSIIVLLDTFYGVAAGSIIVTSVMLVANEPLLDGLQYGAGVGAIAGFGFGVIDSFMLAKRTSAGTYSAAASTSSQKASGLLGISFDENKSIGILNPSLVRQFKTGRGSLSNELSPAVELMNLRINF